jgi:hypothetical protein
MGELIRTGASSLVFLTSGLQAGKGIVPLTLETINVKLGRHGDKVAGQDNRMPVLGRWQHICAAARPADIVGNFGPGAGLPFGR